jgi:hypothetical protein
MPEVLVNEDVKKKILFSDIRTLKSMLYNNEVSVYNLLLVFIERTIKVAFPLNLVTEINFIWAI